MSAVVALLVICLGGMVLGARRFAARQRRLGRWDEHGPLVETEAPPRGNSYKGGPMNERLEVIGKWKGRVVRRRARREPPS